MSSKLIVGVVLVVVLVGAGYVVYTQKANNLGDAAGGTSLAGSDDAGRNDTPDTPMGGIFRGSLFDLAARGGNYICTFTAATAEGESSGTVYVSGDTVRGEFMTSAAGTTMESHMLNMGGYVYTWSPAMPTGMKMRATQGTGDASTGTQGSYSDMQQEYDYDCNAWSLDTSKFALPEGVQFMEFGR